MLLKRPRPSVIALLFAMSLQATPARAENIEPHYAGSKTCASCHAEQSRWQHTVSMANAMQLVAECPILIEHPKLTFREEPYSYQIVRDGSKSIYTVTDGKETITVPLSYAFGLGEAGQTYVFELNGKFFESRVSFFHKINGLDLTMGARNTKPKSLEEAAGRQQDAQDARECFACHTTGGVRANKLHLETMTPGIQCENCHGPAAEHVASARKGGGKPVIPAKLHDLSTEELSDFCGGCHRTWSKIALSGPHGIPNVRFQPYRLTNSKCYDSADPRIRCTACHDVHQDLQRDAAAYDAKCLACHTAAKGAAQVAASVPQQKACPVARKNCTTCHMPKYELPGAHYQFTDHTIRVVKAGAPYPN